MSHLFYGVVIPTDVYWTALCKYYILQKQGELQTNIKGLTSKQVYQLFLRVVDEFEAENEEQQTIYDNGPLEYVTECALTANGYPFGEHNEDIRYLENAVFVGRRILNDTYFLLDLNELISSEYTKSLEKCLIQFGLDNFVLKFMLSKFKFIDGGTAVNLYTLE